MNTGLKGYNNAPGMKTKKGPPEEHIKDKNLFLERV